MFILELWLIIAPNNIPKLKSQLGSRINEKFVRARVLSRNTDPELSVLGRDEFGQVNDTHKKKVTSN